MDSQPLAPKPWYESRTIRIQILSLIVLVIGAIIDSAAQLNIPAQWVAIFTTVVLILNIFIRFDTGQPISGTRLAAIAQPGQDPRA